METSYKAQVKSSHIAGFVYGYSKFIENTCIAIILYFGTLFMINDENLKGEDIFLAMFAIVFAAFGAGQASTYGPDVAKATAAGMKVFKITDTPTQINAIDIPAEAMPIPEDF